MKVDRHGKEKILTTEEINLVFYEGLKNDRDRAIFAICLYTACRINECVTLKTTDVYYRLGQVRPEIIFRKGNTKGKLGTRCIPVIEDLKLKEELEKWGVTRIFFIQSSFNGGLHFYFFLVESISQMQLLGLRCCENGR